MKAVDKAYAAVKDGILGNTFSPGDRITEQQITTLTGVSRTPVREALRRLQSEGLVTVQPNQGAIVARISPVQAAEIFELRGLLESHAARLAAERASAAERAALRRLAERQLELANQPDPDLKRISALNAEFHDGIFAAARNSRLASILHNLMDPFLVMRTFHHYSAEALRRSAQQHLELVRMLDLHDADSAAAVMTHHVLAARHEFRQND